MGKKDAEEIFFAKLAEHLPVRAMHALRRSGRVHDKASLLSLTDEAFFHLPNVGVGTLKVFQAFRAAVLRGEVQLDDEVPIVEDTGAAAEAARAQEQRAEEQRAQLELEKRILALADRYYPVPREEIEAALSDPAKQEVEKDMRRITAALETLLAAGKLHQEHGGYRTYRLSVTKMIERHPKTTERERAIVHRRNEGQTLDEIGATYGQARQNMDQIVRKLLRRCREPQEEQYAKLYETYSFDTGAWHEVFGLDRLGAMYLKNRHPQGRKEAASALEDDTIPLHLRNALQRYLHRSELHVDGVYLHRQRQELLRHFLQHRCTGEVSAREFERQYHDFLDELGCGEDKHLTLNSRYSEENLRQSPLVLWKQGRMIRAYDVGSVDAEEFAQDFHLTDFRDVAVSAQVFLDRYPAEAKRYDLRDAYEFHNLLKKLMTPELLAKYELAFPRMPHLVFGTATEEEQALGLIEQAEHPLTREELADRYREEYGVQQKSFQADIEKFVHPYLHKGVYTLDLVEMTEEEIEKLRGMLTQTFYLMDDLRARMREAFPGRKGILNRRNLGRAGYTLNDRTAYQSQYHGVITALHGELAAHGTLRLASFVADYRTILYVALRDLDLIEYGEGAFVGMERLEKAFGIQKEELRAVNQEIEARVGDRPFTMQALRRAGVHLSIDRLGFEDRFIESILHYSDTFHAQRIGRTWLFCREEATLSALIEDILEEEESIDIDDLRDHLERVYGIAFKDIYKILQVVQEPRNDLFYQDIMRKVYRDRDAFYQEV